jgi:NTP pyrophosphatase (non-canonical NTP hydrolase)
MKDNKKELTLNEYQKQAMTTCMPSSENFSYMFLNLVGEVGEFASKVAKHIRKDKATIHTSRLELYDVSNKENEELMKEAGDILWQLSGLCTVMGWSLEDVAQMNLDKLASRKERNVIDGNGDNR